MIMSWFNKFSKGIKFGELLTGFPRNIVPLLKSFCGTNHLSNILFPSKNVLCINDRVLIDIIEESSSWKIYQSSLWLVPRMIRCDSLHIWSIISDIGTKDESVNVFFMLLLQFKPKCASYGFVFFCVIYDFKCTCTPLNRLQFFLRFICCCGGKASVLFVKVVSHIGSTFIVWAIPVVAIIDGGSVICYNYDLYQNNDSVIILLIAWYIC